MRFPALVAAVALTWCGLCPGQFTANGPTSPDGRRATCDLPAKEHIENKGGSDGAGLCVFTSCEVASRWQGSTLAGFQAWMRQRPGGGWPEKLDEMLTKFCREQRRTIPDYVQHTGGDDEFLELALRTGRMPCVTYAGMDDFYKDRFGRPAKIAHMVNLAHLDDQRAAIVDNNRPGVWVWMSRKDFLSRWRDMNGGWAVVFLDPPPPPYTTAAPQRFDQLFRRPAPVVVQPNCPDGVCPPPVVIHPGPVPVLKFPPPAPIPFPTPTASPAPEPKPASVEKQAEEQPANFGIDTSKVHAGKKWFLNGSACDRDEAFRAVAGLVDDSDKFFLVAVGEPDFLGRVRSAFAALADQVRGKMHLRTYTPAEWPVKQFALPAGLSMRRPASGRIGADAGSFTGDVTPDTLRRFVGDVFDPPKPMPPPPVVPDPKPEPTPVPPPSPVPAPPVDTATWLLAAIAAVIAFLFGTRRQHAAA